mgnify:CR=1 FL=1
MSNQTEDNKLADNSILELEQEIRALKTIIQAMRDEMENMGFANNQAIQETKLLEQAITELNNGNLLNHFDCSDADRDIIKSWFLLTDKPIIYPAWGETFEKIKETMIEFHHVGKTRGIYHAESKYSFEQLIIQINQDAELTKLITKISKVAIQAIYFH